MSVTITPSRGAPVVLDALPGNRELAADHGPRAGGDDVPRPRDGAVRSGSSRCLVDSQAPTAATLAGLASAIGVGDATVSGDAEANDALIDIRFFGDRVLIAEISWKGTLP